MIDLGPHGVFIMGAYGGVAIVVLILILAVVRDNAKQRAKLKALEAAGIRRRSGGRS